MYIFIHVGGHTAQLASVRLRLLPCFPSFFLRKAETRRCRRRAPCPLLQRGQHVKYSVVRDFLDILRIWKRACPSPSHPVLSPSSSCFLCLSSVSLLKLFPVSKSITFDPLQLTFVWRHFVCNQMSSIQLGGAIVRQRSALPLSQLGLCHESMPKIKDPSFFFGKRFY